MIDEISEAKGYLIGDVPVRNPYRACYTIAKFFKNNGTDARAALETITEWIRLNNIDMQSSPAQCVWAAYQNESEISNEKPVHVSYDEIRQIKMVASTRSERILLLAMLCCAKTYADKDGLFSISFTRLASWIGYDTENLRKRVLNVMERFGVINVFKHKDTLRGWKKGVNKCYKQYKLNIHYEDGGELALVNNDIVDLYNRAF